MSVDETSDIDNRDELLAREFLKHFGFSDLLIRYEPDGNVPPDFVVDGKIAIEVRRLNQNYFVGSKVKNLDSLAFQLWDKLKALLTQFSDYEYDRSAFVMFTFSRPLSKAQIKQNLKITKKILLEHLQNIEERKEYTISENFEIWVWPSSKKFESAYILGSSMDDDATGSAEVIKKNLEWILPEKISKIKQYKQNYPEWWLVLIDHIGSANSEFYDPILPISGDLQKDWQRVFCVSPHNTSKWQELTFK